MTTFNDEMYAMLHGIHPATYKANKALPLEKKLKLPAEEAIAALYLARYERKRIKRNRK